MLHSLYMHAHLAGNDVCAAHSQCNVCNMQRLFERNQFFGFQDSNFKAKISPDHSTVQNQLKLERKRLRKELGLSLKTSQLVSFHVSFTISYIQ